MSEQSEALNERALVQSGEAGNSPSDQLLNETLLRGISAKHPAGTQKTDEELRDEIVAQTAQLR